MKISQILALAASSLYSTSAETILEVVAGSTAHNRLEAAVLAADPTIAELLSNPRASLTLFAPDDFAFGKLGADTLGLLLSEPYKSHCKYGTVCSRNLVACRLR